MITSCIFSSYHKKTSHVIFANGLEVSKVNINKIVKKERITANHGFSISTSTIPMVSEIDIGGGVTANRGLPISTSIIPNTYEIDMGE